MVPPPLGTKQSRVPRPALSRFDDSSLRSRGVLIRRIRTSSVQNVAKILVFSYKLFPFSHVSFVCSDVISVKLFSLLSLPLQPVPTPLPELFMPQSS